MEVTLCHQKKNLTKLKVLLKKESDKLTGDTKTQAEGVAEKVASKAKEVAEDAKGAVEGAIRGVKNLSKKTIIIIVCRSYKKHSYPTILAELWMRVFLNIAKAFDFRI